MLDRDTVLVVTGARELTRFHRDGTRHRIELPFAPLATQISTHVFAVDARGATHRFSLDGIHEGFVPLRVELAPRAAAVSRDGRRLVVLVDTARYFVDGIEHGWTFTHRTGDWRETGVGLSGDGTSVLVAYSLRDGLALGDRLDAFVIVRADGVTHFRHLQHALPQLAVAMSHDARLVAFHLDDQYVRVHAGVSMARLHLIEPRGEVQAMRWFGERLAVLFADELAIVDGERVRRVTLPERFTDVVLAGADEAVCLHPELGAWWIRTTVAAAT